MTHAVWIAASLLFALFGIAPASVDRAARLAIRFATGIVIGGTVMVLESLLGIPWTRIGLAVPMVLVAIGSMVLRGRRVAGSPGHGVTGLRGWLPRDQFIPRPRDVATRRPGDPATRRAPNMAAALPIGAITLLLIYGIATARMTCGDLLYFWAPKAQHFFFAQKIDTEFLKFPHYYLMHPDYPPLLPMVYTWCSIAAHRFSYWGAAFLTPLYLLAAVLAFRGFAAQKIGERRATASATLLAAVLAFGFAEGHTAGGADPQLVMFEVIALAALTFGDAHVIAAIALAGAAFTKVEGAAFAAVVVVAYTLVRRDWRRALVLTAPAVILLGSWILFARHHGLLDSYGRGGTPLHTDKLGLVLSVAAFEARYHAMYLPWIVSLAPLALARHWGRAVLPLLVAGGAIVYTIFFYLHEPDAVWWIRASAERVLLTPLAALVVASAAASD